MFIVMLTKFAKMKLGAVQTCVNLVNLEGAAI